MTRMPLSPPIASHDCPLTSPDHPALALLPEVPTRDELEAFGQFLRDLESENGIVDIGTMHHQAEGLYGRSVVIPAGSFLAGLPHKAGHINVCVGDITVWTERGRQRLTGAHILTSPAGAMRVGFAHVDTTWLSVHRNDTGSDDIAALEAALVHHPERLMSRRQQEQLQ